MDQSTNQPAENVPAPVPTKVNGLAVASIVLGVIAILTGLFVLGGLLGLIGLVLGLMSLKEAGGKKPGLIGVALNAVAILLALIAVIFGVKLFDVVRDSTKDASAA
jgi:membrane-bound ClpP family serine protease